VSSPSAIMGVHENAPATQTRPGAWPNGGKSVDTKQDIPLGLCQCGCGRKTTISPFNDRKWGAVKGEPRRFVQGHRHVPSERERLWARVDQRKADECWLWTGAKTAHGYGYFRFDGRLRHSHLLVAEEVYGSRPEEMETRHLCGVKLCCNPAHLAWGTRSDNERDKIRHGRSNRGSRQGQAKLVDEQVRAIRRGRVAGETNESLAREFGVSGQTVCDIIKRRTWAWLDD